MTLNIREEWEKSVVESTSKQKWFCTSQGIYFLQQTKPFLFSHLYLLYISRKICPLSYLLHHLVPEIYCNNTLYIKMGLEVLFRAANAFKSHKTPELRLLHSSSCIYSASNTFFFPVLCISFC